MELIRHKKAYVDPKTNETKEGYDYFLVHNGVKVLVRCVFKEDYKAFKMLSSEEL